MKARVVPEIHQKKKICGVSCFKLGGGGGVKELRKRGWRTAKTTYHYTYMCPPIPLPPGVFPTILIDVPAPRDIWKLAHALHRRGTKTQAKWKGYYATYSPPYVFGSGEYRQVGHSLSAAEIGSTTPAEFEICLDSLWSVSATWENGNDYRPRWHVFSGDIKANRKYV
jgi:hypothetical protein